MVTALERRNDPWAWIGLWIGLDQFQSGIPGGWFLSYVRQFHYNNNFVGL
jgi:hypothetical protein